jgi:hypothetical protein
MRSLSFHRGHILLQEITSLRLATLLSLVMRVNEVKAFRSDEMSHLRVELLYVLICHLSFTVLCLDVKLLQLCKVWNDLKVPDSANYMKSSAFRHVF